MGARWNNTRGQAAQSDRQMSMDELVEMDGTGLHERDNWPLVDSQDRSSSTDTVETVDRTSRYDPGEYGNANAVMRKSEDILQQPVPLDANGDTSDIEEESDDSASASRKDESSTSTSPDLDVEPTTLSTDEDQAVTLQHLEPRTQGEAVDTPSGQPADATVPTMRSSTAQSFTTEFSEGSGFADENAAYRDEERDIMTPIQSGYDNGHEYSSSTASSPPGYGRSTPTTNGPGRPSSVMKSTPPSRTASRRSQQITPLRDRVRYSWQSVQDDEPNRPRIHIIKLISNTATASAGFPQGEAFGFSMSPGGRRLAAYNSARLYVLQTAALPVGISQDFALRRRPLAVEIVDEGNVLAILADEHTVNIYDLGHQQLRRMRTIKTDFPTNCIALSPTGALIAAAYEGGVEIFSLAQGALPTDRRAVRCPKMDRLTFSADSSTLLGTTVRINMSSTMAVSVPVFPGSSTNIPTHEELKEAWCSELLHPENIRNSSHAIFMRENRETSNDRLFAWNGLEDTFGILNIHDMQYGAIDFPVVISPPLSTCGGLGAAIHSPPAMDEHGETVAMIVNDRTIRLYIVPRKPEDIDTTIEAHSIDHELDEGYGCPFTEVRWVYSASSLPAPPTNQTANPTHVQGRLVVASPGGIMDQGLNEEPVDDIEGGRIILFDFDPQFAGQPGQTYSLTLGKSQPQLLEEPPVDVAEEVALVRRRTVNQSRGGGLSTRPITLGRAASTFGRRPSERSPLSGTGTSSGRAVRTSLLSISSEASRSLPDLMESNEAMDTFEEPYAQGAPRSQASLQRAASNAQRHRFQTLEERTQERVTADQNTGFLALPEYTEEPNAPLPSRFRAMAGLDTPAAGPASKPAVITSTNGDRVSPSTSPPSTAPVTTAETFSAEQAFHAATNQMQAEASNDAHHSPTPSSSTVSERPLSPVARSATFDSITSMPRSLRRAYGNAPPGVDPPNVTGDWGVPSPIESTASSRPFASSSQSYNMRGSGLSPTMDIRHEEQTWDATMPTSTPRHPPGSPFGRSAQAGTTYRYSTSLLNPPGYSSPIRGPPSISSFSAGESSPTSTVSSRTRRLPAHMNAFRTAAVTNASASLFPPNQPTDHVPVREPSASAGSVPHPVTAWHPPAASINSGAPGGSLRGHHSRHSSASNKTAFASTTKAKRLGFFRTGTRKGKNKQLFGPEFAPSNPPSRRRGGAADSMMETKSMFTTLTRGEGRCAVM